MVTANSIRRYDGLAHPAVVWSYMRWDGGANRKKTRRVPITPKLAVTIKGHEAARRPGAVSF